MYQYVLILILNHHVHHHHKVYIVKKRLLKLNLFHVHQDIVDTIIQQQKKKLLNIIQQILLIKKFILIVDVQVNDQVKNNILKKLLLMREMRKIEEILLILNKIKQKYMKDIRLTVINLNPNHQKIIVLLMELILNKKLVLFIHHVLNHLFLHVRQIGKMNNNNNNNNLGVKKNGNNGMLL